MAAALKAPDLRRARDGEMGEFRNDMVKLLFNFVMDPNEHLVEAA